MTDIDKIIGFIAKYDQQFPDGIRGAALNKIEALESVATGQPLPMVYREFLQAMGEGMDWLRPLRAKFNIDDLLAYYRSESWRPPTGYLKIGLAVDDPFFDVYLEAFDTSQPRVVSMPGTPTLDFPTRLKAFRTPVAGSLTEFLGTSAYRTLRLNILPDALRIAGNEAENRLLSQVQTVLEPFEFKPLWFSNDWVQIFDAPDAALIATQFPKSVLAIDIAAVSNDRLDELSRTLKKRFDLVHIFPLRTTASPS